MGYGNVVAANSVLRSDYLEDNKLIIGKTNTGKTINFRPRAYPGLRRILENNIIYIANLMALEEWYIHIRRPFFDSQELGQFIFSGLIDKMDLVKRERINRLYLLAEKVKASSGSGEEKRLETPGRRDFFDNFKDIEGLFTVGIKDDAVDKSRDDFLSAFQKAKKGDGAGYIAEIQGLSANISGKGTLWLQKVVDAFCEKASEIVPAFRLFRS